MEKRGNALFVWSPSTMLSSRLVPTPCVEIVYLLHGETMGVGLAQSAGTSTLDYFSYIPRSLYRSM